MPPEESVHTPPTTGSTVTESMVPAVHNNNNNDHDRNHHATNKPSESTFATGQPSSSTPPTPPPMIHSSLQVLPPPPPPPPLPQSSEEESVAENGYLSEISNVSVSLPAAVTNTRGSSSHPVDGTATTTATTTSPTADLITSSHTIDNLFPSTDNHDKQVTYKNGNDNSRNDDEDNDPMEQDKHINTNHENDMMENHEENDNDNDHCPKSLPKFPDVQSCMWTASWAANCPTEDRSASLVNLLLQPLPPNYDSETQLAPLEPDYKTLIRLNLWAVIDGHGGGCVATYSSEVLLPHIAASISRALNCAIVDRGVCMVNGQLRDANALDLDGLIKTSDRCHGSNPNSIHYRSPYERSDSEDEEYGAGEEDEEEEEEDVATTILPTVRERKQMASLAAGNALVKDLPRTRKKNGSKMEVEVDATVSSVKTSVKTTTSLVNREELVGTHSPREVASITRALTESFLAVDEGWINSIDPVATQQTSCQSNGRWNSGACALVVFTIQRLDWTNVAEPEREKNMRGLESNRLNTSQNRDAARRRMLDYARRSKSASSVSTTSSTSSLTTEEVNASGIESEITETEGEDDDRFLDADVRKRVPTHEKIHISRRKKKSLINPSSKSSSYCYKAQNAMIYTAHVGDCRAVMLGSAPPRTIKVGSSGGGLLSSSSVSASQQDTTDDEESSHHSSDETECLSSSDHDADSSEDDDVGSVALTGSGIPISNASTASVATSTTATTTTASTSTSAYINLPRRVVRQRNRAPDDSNGPYIALPPLDVSEESKAAVDIEFETELERRENRNKTSGDSSSDSQDSVDIIPLVQLPPGTSPIDLTTDHSAYNPAEVTAVLRRCNNAPRAISAGVGGGIKRVAGSLAVTRALGDAYLKTPLLSFLPYKSYAPYISARPEVNCRTLNNDGDKVLILATDGVWERASGEDVLRWVRNFYEERVAEAERRKRRTLNHIDKSQSSNDDDDDDNDSFEPVPVNKNFPQEGSERDLFEKSEVDVVTSANPRKRELSSNPPGALNAATSSATKRRKRSHHTRRNDGTNRGGGISYNVADVIIRRVLNKVRRSRNISSLQALMSLPQGRARRSKHDDITASVVDLSAFVS